MFTITPLLKSLESSASIILVFAGEKLGWYKLAHWYFSKFHCYTKPCYIWNKLVLCNSFPFFKTVFYVTTPKFFHACQELRGLPLKCDSLPSYQYWILFQHEVSWSEVLSVPPMIVVIFLLAFPARLFLQFFPCSSGVVLWGTLVVSHRFFGWPVAFWNFVEFSLTWNIQVICLIFECLQTVMPFFSLLK